MFAQIVCIAVIVLLLVLIAWYWFNTYHLFTAMASDYGYRIAYRFTYDLDRGRSWPRLARYSVPALLGYAMAYAVADGAYSVALIVLSTLQLWMLYRFWRKSISRYHTDVT